MNNSGFYYSKMTQYQNEINELTEEKSKYETLLPKLTGLVSELQSLGSKLSESESCYKNGGFVSGEETYDRGILKNCYTKVDNDSTKIVNASTAAKNKVDELEEKIRTAKQNLESATSDYYSALRKEREGE